MSDDLCNGKVRFRSMSRARKIARQVSKRHDQKMNGYRCRSCGFFHVGTTMGKARREGRIEEIEA